MQQFCSALIDTFNGVLQPFYRSSNKNELIEQLPEALSSKEVNLIVSQWPFFAMARSHVVPNMYFGFPPCSAMKIAVQLLYNSLKGGLDSNTQQFQSIIPPIRTGFEQKYVVCLIISIVTNAWRSHQLLNQPIEDKGGFSMHRYRKALVNNCLSLNDFNYNLSMALIQSSSDPYFKMF